jgi:Na+-transporting methylmalonyl-CoA/oxaloacetate decarboxylase gamma subunit
MIKICRLTFSELIHCFYLEFYFMADKRNIVIKVNYPLSEKGTRNLAPKMITEWNVNRIAFAVGVVVLVLALLIYVINKEQQKVDSVNLPAPVNSTEQQVSPKPEAKQPELKKQEISAPLPNEVSPSLKSKNAIIKIKKPTASVEPIKKQADSKITKEHEHEHTHAHVVSRSLVTYGIKNKEPVGEIAGSLKLSGKKPTWVYYFTELKGMKGSRVYHEWLKNGSLVSKMAIVIAGDAWRTSSRKLLTESDKGKWTVKIVDENNRFLNERTFKVE